MQEHGIPLICRIEPVRKLVIDLESAHDCLKLSWFRGPGHKVIAGAFSDGSFALWDISSNYSLNIGNEGLLYPYEKITRGHFSSINSLDLADKGMEDDPEYPGELVTGSSDRTCAIWDLENLNGNKPIQSVKRGFVNDVSWMRHHPGQAIVAFDDVFLQSHTHSVVFEFRDGSNRMHPIIAQNSPIISQSCNPWFNVVMSASSGGELLIFIAPNLDKALEHDKDLKKRRAYLYRTEVEKDPYTHRVNRLRFVDNCPKIKDAPLEELKKAWIPELMTMEDISSDPISNLYVVKQNTNPHALGWVFSGGQAGLGRIQRVPILMTNEVEKAVAKVQKQNI